MIFMNAGPPQTSQQPCVPEPLCNLASSDSRMTVSQALGRLDAASSGREVDVACTHSSLKIQLVAKISVYFPFAVTFLPGQVICMFLIVFSVCVFFKLNSVNVDFQNQSVYPVGVENNELDPAKLPPKQLFVVNITEARPTRFASPRR